MKNYVFHPLAGSELNESRKFFNETGPDNGDRFIESIGTAIRRALARPHGGRPTLSNCRLSEVPRFPYHVIYKVRDDDLLIVAIAHTRRKPGYWVARVD